MHLGPITSVAVGIMAAVGLGNAYDAMRPQAIVVHDLHYENGHIVQDRTVSADGDYFFAGWRAQINYASTGSPVPGCQGDGQWNYPVGRREFNIPLSEWVGSDQCTPDSLDPALDYVPVATWFWGSDQEVHTGGAFKPAPTIVP